MERVHGKSESQLARQSFAEIISETISPGFGQVRLADQFPILCVLLSMGGSLARISQTCLFIQIAFFYFLFWGLARGQANRL